jgi:hypothetical protein
MFEEADLLLPEACTAEEKWDYGLVIKRAAEDRPWWIDLTSNSYRASHALIEGVVKGPFLEDVHGVFGIFLFRHYLELELKRLILWGRMLETSDKNAVRQDVKEAWGHDLVALWKSVLKDTKPKIRAQAWDALDTNFVEKCVEEFDAVDKKSVAFRYPGFEAERCRFDFDLLLRQMEHIKQVLDRVLLYLRQAHGSNEDWARVEMASPAIWTIPDGAL